MGTRTSGRTLVRPMLVGSLLTSGLLVVGAVVARVLDRTPGGLVSTAIIATVVVCGVVTAHDKISSR